MTTADYNSTASVVVQGGASATALAFFGDSIVKMIPYLIAAVPLIFLDLWWGVKAARHRGEKIRLSKGIRKTFGKMVEYVAWVLLASTLSLAFSLAWIEWVVLGVVFANELASIVGNYLETRGLEVSWKHVFRAALQVFGQRTGTNTDGIDPAAFVKPKGQDNDEKEKQDEQ